jgi:di/tricarboxylate transporter
VTYDQAIIFSILGLSMLFFLLGKWRYDVVAFTAFLSAVVAGVIPSENAFNGFSHPAVVTVAAVLIISKTLQTSGVIDNIAIALFRKSYSQSIQRGVLSGLGATLSAFMNNIGALALLMPVALRISKKPGALLMPLSFGSILGGLVTLIGTPPNIIIANYRTNVTGEPFRLFDFAPVGAPVALIGLIYIVLIGWRFIPKNRKGRKSAIDLFDVENYVTEVRVPDDSNFIGKYISELENYSEERSIVVGLIRDKNRILNNLSRVALKANDRLLIRTDPAVFDKLINKKDIELANENKLDDENLRSDEIGLIEVVIPPSSFIEGRSAQTLRLRQRYSVALIAMARQGQPVNERLGNVIFKAGDVLLLQGESELLTEITATLGCLPLAERGLSFGRPKKAWLPITLFASAILATAFNFVPIHISFSTVVVVLILLRTITPREAYESVDWSVIILLGSMIPLGNALQLTGGTELIAQGISGIASTMPTFVIITLLLVVTMTLSDLMNNAATAIVMAPIGSAIAQQLEVNVDPFLMAIAIGASCAFLTPIGHQNNVLVMGPGGYKFGDYWRMGLPLEILVVIVSVPLILLVWPL